MCIIVVVWLEAAVREQWKLWHQGASYGHSLDLQ